jgi:hypothetical protein
MIHFYAAVVLVEGNRLYIAGVAANLVEKSSGHTKC